MKIKSISLGDLKIKFALFFFLNSLSIFCLSSAANTNTSTVQTVSEVCTIEVRPKTIKFSNCAGISQKEIPTAIFKIQFLEAFRWPLVTEAIIKRSPKYYKLSHGNYRRKILDERIEKNRKLQQNMISFVSSSGFDLQLQNELLAEIENWTAKNQDNLPPPKKISPVGLLNLLLKKSKHTIPKPELEKNPILIALLSTRIFRDHLSKVEYLKIPDRKSVV